MIIVLEETQNDMEVLLIWLFTQFGNLIVILAPLKFWCPGKVSSPYSTSHHLCKKSVQW